MRLEVDIEGNITEHEDAPITLRSKEEIEAEILNLKIQEANQYLKDTDWVSDYKLRHDLGLEIIPEDSSKWAMIAKREEYILFLKGVKNA